MAITRSDGGKTRTDGERRKNGDYDRKRKTGYKDGHNLRAAVNGGRGYKRNVHKSRNFEIAGRHSKSKRKRIINFKIKRSGLATTSKI